MRRPILPLLFLLCLAIVFLYGLGVPLRPAGRLEAFSGEVRAVEGTVTAVQVKDGYYALTVRLKDSGIFPEKCLLRAELDMDAEEAFSLMGRYVRGVGKIELPSGPANPRDFNYRLYLMARDVRTICRVSRFKFNAGRVMDPFLNFTGHFKGRVFARMSGLMEPESFGLFAGLMFGEKGYMDSGQYEEFQKNGIAHVLAVSGLHVNFMYELIQKLLGGKKRRRDSAAGMVFLIFYAALAGFSFSVMRAVIMIALRLIAFYSCRRYDAVSAAAATAIIFLLINPYVLFDSGTQLSFVCVYCIGVVMPWVRVRAVSLANKRKSEKINDIYELMGTALTVQLGMLPLSVYHFTNVAPLGLILNIPAVFLAGLIVPFGALACFFPCGLTAKLTEGLCKALSALSGGAASLIPSQSCPAPPLGLLLCFYALMFFFFSDTRYILHRKKLYVTLTSVYVVLLVSASFLPYSFGFAQSPLPWKYNRWDAVFLNVGQGDCLHLHSRGKDVLVDGGGKYGSDIALDTLAPYLLKNGIRHLDMAIVTHLDSDHSKGIEQLSQIMKTDVIAFPVSCRGEDLSGFNADKIIFLDAGDKISIGGGVLSVLWPFEGEALDSNQGSLVARYEKGGCSYLLTADIDEETEGRLLELYDPSADVLKVAHHGSKYSSSEAFVRAVDPKLAVISVGRGNFYGHPSDRVVELLQNCGIMVKRTDIEGAVCINPQK